MSKELLSPKASGQEPLPSRLLQRVVGGSHGDDKQHVDSSAAVGLTAGGDEASQGTAPSCVVGSEQPAMPVAKDGKPADEKARIVETKIDVHGEQVGDDIRKGPSKVSPISGSKDAVKMSVKVNFGPDSHSGGTGRDSSIEMKSPSQDALDQKALEEHKAYDQALRQYETQKAEHDRAHEALDHAKGTCTKTQNELGKSQHDLRLQAEHLTNQEKAMDAAGTTLADAKLKAKEAESQVVRAIKHQIFVKEANDAHKMAAYNEAVAQKVFNDQKTALEKVKADHRAAEQQVELKKKTSEVAQHALDKAKQAPALAKLPVKPVAPQHDKPAEPKKGGKMLDGLKKDAVKNTAEILGNFAKWQSKQDAKKNNAYTKDDTRMVIEGGTRISKQVGPDTTTETMHVDQTVLEGHDENWNSRDGSGTDEARQIVIEIGHEEKVTTTGSDGSRHETIDRHHSSVTGSVAGHYFSGDTTVIEVGGKVGGRMNIDHAHIEKTTTTDGREKTFTLYSHQHVDVGADGGGGLHAGGLYAKAKIYAEYLVEKGVSWQGPAGEGTYKVDVKGFYQTRVEGGGGIYAGPNPDTGKFGAGLDLGYRVDQGPGTKFTWELLSKQRNGIQVENQVMINSHGVTYKPNVELKDGKFIFTMGGSVANGAGVGSVITLTADIEGAKTGLSETWAFYKLGPSDTYDVVKRQLDNPVLAAGYTIASKIPGFAVTEGVYRALKNAFQ